MKYFLYNKAMDYKKGYMENCVYDGSLHVKDLKQGHGSFISRLMDSREKETIWHRLLTECQCPGDASVQFSLYASEKRSLYTKNGPVDLEDYLHDPEISMEEKKGLCKPYLVREALNPADLLLYEAKGRYLWFLIELYSQGTESPALKTIQVFFPRESWEQYLPAIYRSGGDPNSFLSRYLAIFQTIYGEMEEKLQDSGRLLDSRCVDGELLSWLAGWLDVGNVHIWPEERLRSFLLQAVDLYKLRGTREGILRTAELYTGSPAWLVEYQELLSLLSDSEKRESWERLYGVDKSVSFLLLKEEALPGQEQYRAFQCILDDMRPARIQVKVILLKSFLILGGHSYLGINSRLERLRPMMLDGTAHLPFTALKNNGQDMEE